MLLFDSILSFSHKKSVSFFFLSKILSLLTFGDKI